MSGAIGSEQLKKWPQIEQRRIDNAKHFVSLFHSKPWCRIQQIVGESSWFTFGIVLDGKLKGRRAEIVKALDEAGIQNRPLASRNFLKQPVMRDLDYIASGEMTAADDIHDNGFFVGNGSKDIRDELDQLYTTIVKFVK
jgi:CDP-6-deoxy-D-xylo-4-hexulose-3-dehydrase